jgi:cell cycle checkpoint protein
VHASADLTVDPGTAFIFSEIFDEYAYHAEDPPTLSSQDSDAAADNTAFEVPLNTLIECLNIFGTAGTASTSATTSGKYKKWKKPGDDSDRDDEGNRRADADTYVGGGPEKRTRMRMTYAGSGYPLTLLL